MMAIQSPINLLSFLKFYHYKTPINTSRFSRPTECGVRDVYCSLASVRHCIRTVETHQPPSMPTPSHPVEELSSFKSHGN